MERLKKILEQAKEIAQTEKQKTEIDKMIADIDDAHFIEGYNALVPLLVQADDVEELNRTSFVGCHIDELSNTIKLVTGAAALWRERLGWSQSSGIAYAPILSFDCERVLTASCYTPHYLGMPTEEVANAFGEKYKLELKKIYNYVKR